MNPEQAFVGGAAWPKNLLETHDYSVERSTDGDHSDRPPIGEKPIDAGRRQPGGLEFAAQRARLHAQAVELALEFPHFSRRDARLRTSATGRVY